MGALDQCFLDESVDNGDAGLSARNQAAVHVEVNIAKDPFKGIFRMNFAYPLCNVIYDRIREDHVRRDQGGQARPCGYNLTSSAKPFFQ
jgi:hypothetical protein